MALRHSGRHLARLAIATDGPGTSTARRSCSSMPLAWEHALSHLPLARQRADWLTESPSNPTPRRRIRTPFSVANSCIDCHVQPVVAVRPRMAPTAPMAISLAKYRRPATSSTQPLSRHYRSHGRPRSRAPQRPPLCRSARTRPSTRHHLALAHVLHNDNGKRGRRTSFGTRKRDRGGTASLCGRAGVPVSGRVRH